VPYRLDDRIDRIQVSGPLGAAIGNDQPLDQPPSASDHHGVAIDTDAIDQQSLWTYR
jgi:hypothetical protein